VPRTVPRTPVSPDLPPHSVRAKRATGGNRTRARRQGDRAPGRPHWLELSGTSPSRSCRTRSTRPRSVNGEGELARGISADGVGLTIKAKPSRPRAVLHQTVEDRSLHGRYERGLVPQVSSIRVGPTARTAKLRASRAGDSAQPPARPGRSEETGRPPASASDQSRTIQEPSARRWKSIRPPGPPSPCSRLEPGVLELVGDGARGSLHRARGFRLRRGSFAQVPGVEGKVPGRRQAGRRRERKKQWACTNSSCSREGRIRGGLMHL
jgi:hypothetical protein